MARFPASGRRGQVTRNSFHLIHFKYDPLPPPPLVSFTSFSITDYLILFFVCVSLLCSSPVSLWIIVTNELMTSLLRARQLCYLLAGHLLLCFETFQRAKNLKVWWNVSLVVQATSHSSTGNNLLATFCFKQRSKWIIYGVQTRSSRPTQKSGKQVDSSMDRSVTGRCVCGRKLMTCLSEQTTNEWDLGILVDWLRIAGNPLHRVNKSLRFLAQTQLLLHSLLCALSDFNSISTRLIHLLSR